MYACHSCHLTYFLFWEYTYHLFVQCPNKEHWKKESIKHDFPRLPYMTSNVCYRCGRVGHYSRRNKCSVVYDVCGNLITWG